MDDLAFCVQVIQALENLKERNKTRMNQSHAFDGAAMCIPYTGKNKSEKLLFLFDWTFFYVNMDVKQTHLSKNALHTDHRQTHVVGFDDPFQQLVTEHL